LFQGSQPSRYVEVEKGKPRAEIGLVLRTIANLGTQLVADGSGKTKERQGPDPVDIVPSSLPRARKENGHKTHRHP
jgi:hypothetical protein